MKALEQELNKYSLKIRFATLSTFTTGALLLVLVGIGVFALLQQSRVFAIRAIPLDWSERLNGGRMESEIAREIEASIGVQFADVMGKLPWEVDLKKLNRVLQDMPWIRSVQIRRVLPDRLAVSILPKHPLAVIVASSTSLRPISQTGEVMPEWKSTIVPDVPFLRGEKFLHDSTVREKAVAMILSLPSDGVLARSNLAEIGWTKGYTLLLLSPRVEIQLGTELDSAVINTKLLRVAQVLNYLSTQKIKAPVIDATSVKKVVVRAQHRP